MNIKEHRKELGLRQREIASAAGCVQSMVAYVECGNLPGAWKIVDFTKAYRLKSKDEFKRLVAAVRGGGCNEEAKNGGGVRHLSRVPARRAARTAGRNSAARSMQTGLRKPC